MKLTALPFHLRPIEDADITWVFEALSDPQVYRHYGVRYHSLEETGAQMAWYADLRSAGTGLWFAVTEGSGRPVGAIGFNDYDKTHQLVEIGYWLLREHWGKGIIKTVFPPALRFAFRHWPLHRIEAIVESENTASRRLLERFGFRYEGTRRECEFKDGRFINHEIFGLLSSDDHPFASDR